MEFELRDLPMRGQIDYRKLIETLNANPGKAVFLPHSASQLKSRSSNIHTQLSRLGVRVRTRSDKEGIYVYLAS